MKKINLFIAPVMAISLLTNCGGGGNPEPQPPEPEPTVTTYTVVLQATEGSSFDGGEKYLFLNDVPEGTPLNECKGYYLPTHRDYLDFNYWHDEHGNIVPVNTPVNSNLHLTSKFYHGPEFERRYVRTSIEDEWWSEINNKNWAKVFSSENDKKVFDSFLKLTYETLNNSKLSTVEAVDNFKKIYDYAKRQLYIHREETTGTGEFINDLILKAYQNTVNDMFSLLTDNNKAGIFVNLSYAYFVDSCFALANERVVPSVCLHAYDSLEKLINELPNDDINLIQTWDYVVSKLLIVASYAAEDSTFDASLELVKNEIKELLENKDYTPDDVKEIAKILANYHLAAQREGVDRKALYDFVKYIFANYFSEDPLMILITNLCKRYLAACASDESYNVNTKTILDIKDIFKNKIENVFDSYPTHAERYFSIATLFAEAVCYNPDETESVLAIVDNFNKKIDSEDEEWGQPYLYYIDAFASFAEELSEFNLFIGGIKPSYKVYERNKTIVLDTIQTIINSGNATQENFKVIIDLVRYIAKISNYMDKVYDTSEFPIYSWMTNYILDYASLPLDIKDYNPNPVWVGTLLLPLELGEKIATATLKSFASLDKSSLAKLFGALGSSFLNEKKYFPLAPIFNELISKWLSRPLCSCGVFSDELFKCLTGGITNLSNNVSGMEYDVFMYRLCCKTYLSVLDNKSVYRGDGDEQPDLFRSFEMLKFINDQMALFSKEKICKNFDGMYNCVIKVLLNDYIPNITDDITCDERYELENEVASKIETLIENY